LRCCGQIAMLWSSQDFVMCKLLSCANYYHVQIIIMCKVILHLTEDAC